MATEVTMPKLAMTQESGTILQWYKEVGDQIERGEPLLEVMTNKTNVDVEAYEDGVLLRRLYVVGDEVPVLQVIAYIGEPGEEVRVSNKETSGVMKQSGASSVELRETLESNDGVTVPIPNSSLQIRATPAARALSRQYNIDLRDVKRAEGSQRISRSDVQAYATQRNSMNTLPKVASAVSQPDPEEKISVQKKMMQSVDVNDEIILISGVRRIIGQRMAQSAFSAPHVTITAEVDMKAANDLRQEMTLIMSKEQRETHLSINIIILKATAIALRRYPNVNSTWKDDSNLIFHKHVHLAMAVATENGLIAPVIHDADRQGLFELNYFTKELAERAKNGKLSPQELEGGTFTITNLGMYGIETFSPIINPPQSAILGVGAVVDKAVAVEGEVRIRPRMMLSLSFDHRAMDGSDAAEYLRYIKTVLEMPMMMLG
ncbi:2-oxo acid dehydrogenase subunit E2 [Alicyclobacillaceae bacterium I2511]|nr:2-oxo acid dehydrogenase subunit E2 [Alicyclobacillaceae bacterium I2511]